jgi:DNA mismatch repair ATPase MutS
MFRSSGTLGIPEAFRRSGSSIHRLMGFSCRRYPGSLPVFQVGRFYEFYDEHAEWARRLLGLRMLGPGRGLRSRCGFPIRWQRTYLTRLMGLGRRVHGVREEGEWLGGVKIRRLAERWVPLPGPAGHPPHG